MCTLSMKQRIRNTIDTFNKLLYTLNSKVIVAEIWLLINSIHALNDICVGVMMNVSVIKGCPLNTENTLLMLDSSLCPITIVDDFMNKITIPLNQTIFTMVSKGN